MIRGKLGIIIFISSLRLCGISRSRRRSSLPPAAAMSGVVRSRRPSYKRSVAQLLAQVWLNEAPDTLVTELLGRQSANL